jgi:tripartite-type tricarboxylate transporter receptor subunit TctC
LAEIMAGRIDFYSLPIAPAIAVVENGKVVALAVTTPQRAPLLPNVPTVTEAGYPRATYLFWGGLSVPAKTPRAIVDKLHAVTKKALDMPVVKERLAKVGVQPMPMTVDEFAKFASDDVAETVKLAKEIGLGPTN